jgi:hypothetical protein
VTPATDPEAVRTSLMGRFAPVVDLLAGRLGDQLVAVLLHGSAMRGCPTADDFDLIIALRSPAVASVRARCFSARSPMSIFAKDTYSRGLSDMPRPHIRTEPENRFRTVISSTV